MKKFYNAVTTGPAVGGGFVVLLDGRPVRTPEKHLMTAPSKALANVIAAEWLAQQDLIIPETMPLTQLLTTAIDRAVQREAMTVAVTAYIDSDLLCYLADAPEELKLEQERLWVPPLQWFEKSYGVPLLTTYALNRLDQPEEAHAKIGAAITAMDIHAFTAFHSAVSVTGSIVLALALMARALSAVEIWRCALCEEFLYEKIHDLEKYGCDPVEEKRRQGILRDLEAAQLYLKLYNQP